MRLPLAALALLGLAIALVVLTRPHPPTTLPPPAPSRDAAAVTTPPPPPTLPTIDAAVAASGGRAEREHMVAQIVDRLGGHESWNAQGIELLQAFGGRAQTTTDLGCYMAGCVATFTFASESTYRAAYDDVTATRAYAAWTGGKRVSSPEVLPDGRVIVAIALERPD